MNVFSLATTSRGRCNYLVTRDTGHDLEKGQSLRRGKRGCFEKKIVEDAVVVVVEKKSRVLLLIIEKGIGPIAAQAVEIIAEALDP